MPSKWITHLHTYYQPCHDQASCNPVAWIKCWHCTFLRTTDVISTHAERLHFNLQMAKNGSLKFISLLKIMIFFMRSGIDNKARLNWASTISCQAGLSGNSLSPKKKKLNTWWKRRRSEPSYFPLSARMNITTLMSWSVGFQDPGHRSWTAVKDVDEMSILTLLQVMKARQIKHFLETGSG